MAEFISEREHRLLSRNENKEPEGEKKKNTKEKEQKHTERKKKQKETKADKSESKAAATKGLDKKKTNEKAVVHSEMEKLQTVRDTLIAERKMLRQRLSSSSFDTIERDRSHLYKSTPSISKHESSNLQKKIVIEESRISMSNESHDVLGLNTLFDTDKERDVLKLRTTLLGQEMDRCDRKEDSRKEIRRQLDEEERNVDKYLTEEKLALQKLLEIEKKIDEKHARQKEEENLIEQSIKSIQMKKEECVKLKEQRLALECRLKEKENAAELHENKLKTLREEHEFHQNGEEQISVLTHRVTVKEKAADLQEDNIEALSKDHASHQNDEEQRSALEFRLRIKEKEAKMQEDKLRALREDNDLHQKEKEQRLILERRLREKEEEAESQHIQLQGLMEERVLNQNERDHRIELERRLREKEKEAECQEMELQALREEHKLKQIKTSDIGGHIDEKGEIKEEHVEPMRVKDKHIDGPVDKPEKERYYGKPFVPPFDGTSFEEWKLEVTCLQNSKLYPDHLLRQSVRCSLKGPTKKVLLTMEEHVSTEEIVKKLQDIYGRIATEDSDWQDFFTAVQKEGETSPTWAIRLESILQFAARGEKMEEVKKNKMLKNRFWKGLRDERLKSATRVSYESEDSFEILRNKVRKEEKDLANGKVTSAEKNTKENDQDSVMKQLLERMKKLEEEIHKGQSKTTEDQKHRNRQQQQRYNREAEDYAYYPPEDQRNRNWQQNNNQRYNRGREDNQGQHAQGRDDRRGPYQQPLNY